MNQWVWVRDLRIYPGRSSKIQPKYIGPYQVKKVLNYDCYEVQAANSNRTRVENFRRLKPVKILGVNGPVYDLDQLPIDDPEQTPVSNVEPEIFTRSGREVRAPDFYQAGTPV